MLQFCILKYTKVIEIIVNTLNFIVEVDIKKLKEIFMCQKIDINKMITIETCHRIQEKLKIPTINDCSQS